MNGQDGDRRPSGFGGAVSGWTALLPEGAHALRLPRRDAAAIDGGPFDLVEVTAFTESMGRIESFLQSVQELLADGGTLVLDVENLQSTRQLRRVIEGRPGSLDPAGSYGDPSQALPLQRVLSAAAAAGLHVVDCFRASIDPGGPGPEIGKAMFGVGFVPSGWLGGSPPSQHWLVCRRQPAIAGSVLIGPGDAEAQARTENTLARFLPADWECIRCSGDREPVAFNRGLARATGELVWFLRAGAEPETELFHNLVAWSVIGPAAPGDLVEPSHPGDVSGMMIARGDVMLTGPLCEGFANDQVAHEDWCMRLRGCVPEPQGVPGGFATPPPPVRDSGSFAAESDSLLERWAPVTGPVTGPVASDATEPRASVQEDPPWSGRPPRITLCMIARDEEEFLGECLRRAAPAVDEIVLVDTGSTDDTLRIAESFGARVLHHPWNDDFATPRNLGLKEATGDWVLVLDADEFLVEGAVEQIRRSAQDPGISGYHLRFTNLYTSGKTIGVLMVRLFRNLPGLRYENYIHEQVTPSLIGVGSELGLALSIADIEVVHQGYMDEVMTSRSKNERNLRLFEKQLSEHPEDIYSLYKYGDFLRRIPGRGRDARDVLERCLRLILADSPAAPRGLPYAAEVAALCALEYARDERHDQAEGIVEAALRRFVPTPNLHYIAASLALAAGRNDEAIAHYRRCLAYRGQVLVVPIQEGITSHVSITGIAQAHMQKGDLARAERLLDQAMALQPDFDVAHLALSRLHVMRGNTPVALEVLTDYLTEHPDSIGACQQALAILRSVGLTDQARRMGAHALRLMQEGGMDYEAKLMKETLATLG